MNHHQSSPRSMAVAATLHCLTGCAIGEILGLIIGTAFGFGGIGTIVLSIGLAFVFGYTLSTLPLLKSGLAVQSAFKLVLAADTLSIATMELTDSVVMALIPGAMNAGLVNPIFWMGMMIALTAAFFVAYPVNKWLMGRGMGHALVHEHHGSSESVQDWRKFIPNISTSMLLIGITAFILGGLIVSIADELTRAGHV